MIAASCAPLKYSEEMVSYTSLGLMLVSRDATIELLYSSNPYAAEWKAGSPSSSATSSLLSDGKSTVVAEASVGDKPRNEITLTQNWDRNDRRFDA